jgi:hypothetical protein
MLFRETIAVNSDQKRTYKSSSAELLNVKSCGTQLPQQYEELTLSMISFYNIFLVLSKKGLSQYKLLLT